MNKPEKESISLDNQSADYVAMAVKSIGGAVPFVGSFLAELAGVTIPNQRSDRIAKFAILLEQYLENHDKDLIRLKLNDANFTDLAEESIRHAVRAASDERLKYIASLLVNGIKAENISFIESKHLLRILGELNDIEIIWLRWHLVPLMNYDEVFREKHKEILEPLREIRGVKSEKDALFDSYLEHLTMLRLLESIHEIDHNTKFPKVNQWTGRMNISSYEITALGKLLLKQIDLHESSYNIK